MIVTAIFKAKPEKREELKKQLHAGATASWNEPGVRFYAVHQVEEDENSFMNIEVYESESAFQSHLETPYVKSFLGMLDDLLATPLIVYKGNELFAGENTKSAI